MAESQISSLSTPFRDGGFRALAEAAPIAMLVLDGNRVIYANREAEELTGYPVAELLALEDGCSLVAPEYRTACEELRAAGNPELSSSQAEAGGIPCRLKLRRSTGEDIWVEASSRRADFQGSAADVMTLVDATPHRLAEESLARDKELAQVTLASIGDGVIRTDADGRIDYMNSVAEELTGWKLDEVMLHGIEKAYQVIHESTRRPRPNPVELCLLEKRTIVTPGLFALQSRGGDEFIIRDSVAPIPGPGNEVAGAVVVFRDLTRVRGLEQKMVYLESHDTLTGLLHRQEFEIYLEAALENARDQGLKHVMLYLDLWEFKLINDCFGHVAGDELLRRVAAQLQTKVAEQGILGRVGGDDFTLLLENHSTLEARAVARGLQRSFRDFRFNWGGQLFEVGLNVGLVPITAASDSVPQIFRAAGGACYLARQGGRNRIHTYADDDAAVTERHGRLHWVQRIRRALAEDRFCLYQQEIRPLKPGGRALREILIRMVDSSGHHLEPGSFIPIAEHHDLASSIDRWVVRNSLSLLSQIGRSPTSDASADSDRTSTPATHGRVSINLSAQSLGDEAFLENMLDYLETSGVDTHHIFFEITETTAVANLSRALHFIGAVKDMGCRFILDDFGSGFSSFAYLKNLPVDILKIDGEFVRSMENDPIRRAMVASINQVAQVMGIETIAEWVETEATYEMLRELGVDYVQGFWLHRPEPMQ